jgi:hypothetical protein
MEGSTALIHFMLSAFVYYMHSLLYSGYQRLSPGVERLGREADHSPPTSAEVKKTWIEASTPPYVFMA